MVRIFMHCTVQYAMKRKNVSVSRNICNFYAFLSRDDDNPRRVN